MVDVDFVVRSDAPQKFGGDVLQVEKYLDHFPPAISGRVVPVTANLDLRPGAVVHIVNVDRPWDFLHVLGQANGHPIIVSTIHHESARVRRMGSALPRSTRRLVESAAPHWMAELLKFVIRIRGLPRIEPSLRWHHLVTSQGLARAVGAGLSSTDLVVTLGMGEWRQLESDFAVELERVIVLPNGVDLRPSRLGHRDIAVLVPGRIERRKNQIAIARTLGHLPFDVVFVGTGNRNDDSYVRDFARIVDETSNLSWIGAKRPDEMAALYSRARVVVNASQVEVLSLVDLEAYACGCHLVTTIAGHTREWLGDEAVDYCDPDDLSALPGLVREKLACEQPTPDRDILARLDWSAVAANLVCHYSQLGSVGCTNSKTESECDV